MKKMKKILRIMICINIATIMLLGILLPIKANAVTPTSATIDAVKYDSYEQYLAHYYLTYSALDFELNNDELPYHTYVNNCQDDFKKKIATWRFVTMDAGDKVTYSAKEVEFYEFLIFDILYQSLSEDVVVNNMNTALDAVEASTLKDIADLGFNWTADTVITNDNADDILNGMIKCENFKFLASEVDVLKKGIQYTKNLEELIEKMHMLVELNNCTEEVKVILDDMYRYASNSLVKEACRKMALVSTGYLTEAEILGIFSGEVLLEEVTSYATTKIWEGFASSTAIGQGTLIGKGVGKMACNVMFGTDAVVENWYSMEKVYAFEKVLKSRLLSYMSRYENDPSITNARLLNKAADMYLSTVSVGMEYAINYAEAVRGGGIVGLLYKNVFNKDDYTKLINQLQSIKKETDWSIDFANNKTLNMYLSDLDDMNANPVQWEQTPCEVSKEDIDSGIESIKDFLFALTNQTIEEDTTYSEDKLTYANYYLEDGTLDLAGKTLTVYSDFYLNGGMLVLNGGTLIVRGNMYLKSTLNLTGGTVNIEGNLIQSGGKIEVSKGTLNVAGDYHIATPGTNSAGEETWGGCSASLNMQYNEDTVTVGGDFYMCTTSGTYTAGTLTVSGDFIQPSEDYRFDFQASNTHKVILNGTTPQTVHFEYGSSKFATLEIANNSGIVVDGYFAADSLISGDDEVKIQSDNMRITNLTLDVPQVTITGNVMTGTVNIQGNKLNIEGNLIQSDGKIEVNKGTLKVAGDYHIAAPGTNSAGEETWGGCSAGLNMQYDEDVVTVGGDFYMCTTNGTYTAGVLTVFGDFIQAEAYATYNFRASNTHKVILNGTTAQKVYFANNNSKFATLEIANRAGIVVDGYFAANSLISGDDEVKIQSENMRITNLTLDVPQVTITGNVMTGTVNIQGNKLNIEGNLIQSDGKIEVNKGTLKVAGDYHIAAPGTNSAGEETWGGCSAGLNMQYDEDVVTVGGDFYMCTTNGTYTAGVLTVFGDFIQAEAYATYNFRASNTHKVILNGTTAQKVYFANNNSKFATLEIANRAGIVADGYFAAGSLKGTEDVVNIQSNGMKMGDITVNVPTVKVNGNVTVTGTVALMANDLIVGGSLIQPSGMLKVMKGTLTISEDYRIQTMSMDDFGDPIWSGSSGVLSMDYDAGQIKIGGEFYTESNQNHSGHLKAGKMYIAGDFYQGDNNAYNFKASSTHHVVLNGTKPQAVTFESRNSRFRYLHLTQEADQYTFNRDGCWDYYHSNLISETVAPTCAEQGYTSNICQFCGTQYTDNYVAATGHIIIEVLGKEATCTEAGLTDGKKCAACDTVAVEQKVIAAKGHAYDVGVVTTAPDCENEGVRTYTCANDGAHTYTETIAAFGHAYDEGSVSKVPDCEAEGVKTFVCANNKDHTYTEVIPAIGHSYTSVITQPTCTEKGHTTYTCTCGHNYVGDYTDALGHVVVILPGKEATCTEKGLTEGKSCSACGTVIEMQKTVELKGHAEENIPGKEATCTEPGLTDGKKCGICGIVTQKQEVISAEGHKEEKIPGKEATCTEEGLTEGKKCSVCNAITINQETISAKGHTEETLPGKEATCTEEGLTEGVKCSACESVLVKQKTIKTKDHVESSIPGKAATCTEDGATDGLKCDTCGTITLEQEIIPAGHSYSSGEDLDCDACGYVREEKLSSVPMHRMYDPNSGEHFYTGAEAERDFLVNAGWHYEGVGFNFPAEGAPVHRLYDPLYGEHLYTMDKQEMTRLLNSDWNYEGVAFNSAKPSEVPQYRLHNPNAKRGGYHFTGSIEERDFLVSVGWIYEGIGWYSCWE